MENIIIDINNIKISYCKIIPEIAKFSVPIVFLHDSLGCISVWRDFPKLLADSTKRVSIVYDRQGYGGSSPFSGKSRDKKYLEEQADFLIDFLNAVEVEKCILFGHSDGGSISLIAGAKYPERVVAIITEGAHVFVDDITLKGIQQAKNAYANSDLKERLTRYHGDKVEALFNAWTETWLAPSYRDWNIENFLPEITCPLLTIYGENDEFGGPEQAHSMASRVSGYSEKIIMPNAGHNPHKESREATIKVATEFIEQVFVK